MPILVGIVVAIGVHRSADRDDSTREKATRLYESMRPGLFTGFFTLSGFLLSAKTWIVLNMKKEVYGTEAFLKVVKQKLATIDEWPPPDPKTRLTVYARLRDTGDQLTANISVALLTSVLQFTAGLWPSPVVIAICVGFAAASIVVLAFSLYSIAHILRNMYEAFEREAIERMEAYDPKPHPPDADPPPQPPAPKKGRKRGN